MEQKKTTGEIILQLQQFTKEGLPNNTLTNIDVINLINTDNKKIVTFSQINQVSKVDLMSVEESTVDLTCLNLILDSTPKGEEILGDIIWEWCEGEKWGTLSNLDRNSKLFEILKYFRTEKALIKEIVRRIGTK